jgi:hypothetical protein
MYLVEDSLGEVVILDRPDLGRVVLSWDAPKSASSATAAQLAATMRAIKIT